LTAYDICVNYDDSNPIYYGDLVADDSPCVEVPVCDSYSATSPTIGTTLVDEHHTGSECAPILGADTCTD